MADRPWGKSMIVGRSAAFAHNTRPPKKGQQQVDDHSYQTQSNCEASLGTRLLVLLKIRPKKLRAEAPHTHQSSTASRSSSPSPIDATHCREIPTNVEYTCRISMLMMPLAPWPAGLHSRNRAGTYKTLQPRCKKANSVGVQPFV